MIEPTVGRKIWYYWQEDDPGRPLRDGDPMDATVIGVQDDGTINIFVIAPNGMTWHKEGVGITEKPEAGCCMWMPYQVKVATDEATKAAMTTTPVKKELKKV